MKKHYNSVLEMVKEIASNSFYVQFLLYNINRIFKEEIDANFRYHACIRYQENFRIYLDEYPEQQELRKEWLENYIDRNYYNRFIKRN